MSVSSRHKRIFHDDDVVVQIDEPTPSPPPKPPRGVMRKTAPMKPQRSAIKIEPIQNEQCNKENQSKFKHREMMEDMEKYFKRSIQILRSTEDDFTGAEAADVLTDYILKHKDSFTQENVGRHNAVKLLELWREQKIIHAVHPNQKKFEDSDRALFRLGAESEQTLYLSSSPAPSRRADDDYVARTPSTQRSSSFKRFFPLGSLVRRNRSTSRGRDKEPPKEPNTLFKSTWSLFSSSDKNEKKARRAERQLIKEEEAEIYELALFHLLNIIDVEFLEDVALPRDSKKSASFLTSILEKVGLGAGEERLEPEQEDEMDLLIETHPLIRDASQWFQLARCCAPLLYLQTNPGTSQKMQLYKWCKAALTAVSTRFEKMTQNGQSPLFPSEFAPLLSKIASQLINDMGSGDKLNTAIQYLFLMVPHPLRTTIDQLIQWIQLTLRTDAVEDLRSPYYLGKTGPKHKENVKVILDELRPFLFPHNCMNASQMDIFVETLVELRSKGRLGQKPEALETSLRTKCVEPKRRRIERKHSTESGDLTPVRFAAAREPLRGRTDPQMKYLTETDKALVELMESTIEDKNMSLSKKKKQLSEFKKHYPALAERFFSKLI